MLRSYLLAAAVVTTAVLGLTGAASAQNPPAGFTYETLVDGPLQSATAMAFLPDGRLLITERATGNVRLFANGQLAGSPWANIQVHSGGPFAEAGLLGIAVDPDFLNNRYVYVYYTAPGGSENHIARLQDINGSGQNLTVLTQPGAITAQLYHNGGTMVFGHDGTLFVGTGDALGAALAQDLNSWRGKVLRFEVPNLTVPADNPFSGSAVYTYGHRNQFGLTIHPVTGDVFQTENGGGWMDEINRLLPGGNYGWPIVEGQELTPDPALIDPMQHFQPTLAPTGCCFYSGDHYPANYRNAWFYTTYNTNELSVAWLDPTGSTITGTAVFDQLPGHGFVVQQGPDGNLYYLTNDGGGYGADELGRYVHQSEPAVSTQLSSVSNKTLGGSATICTRAPQNSLCVPWLSFSRLPSALATPFGGFWVPMDSVLWTMNVTADNRAYRGLEVPNAPAFLGSSLHCQSAALTQFGQLVLSNPTELVIRG
ncbi:MAG: sorbosone dehydrogenase family protein [Planctomycetota bacterium]